MNEQVELVGDEGHATRTYKIENRDDVWDFFGFFRHMMDSYLVVEATVTCSGECGFLKPVPVESLSIRELLKMCRESLRAQGFIVVLKTKPMFWLGG